MRARLGRSEWPEEHGGARVAKRDACNGTRVGSAKPGGTAGDIDFGARRRALEPTAQAIAARLELQRPLVIVNLATTGALRQHDRAVALFAVKLWPSGDTHLSLDTVNPMRPISRGATATHGITDEDVAGSPAFSAIAAGWGVLLAGSDIAGVDCEGRDIALLQAEYVRVGIDLPLMGRRVDAHRVLLDRDRLALHRAIQFDPTRAAERARRQARKCYVTAPRGRVRPESSVSDSSAAGGVGGRVPRVRTPGGAGDAPIRRCTLEETSPTGPLLQKSRAWFSRPLCSFCGIG